MGVTYRAWDDHAGRPVVLKCPKPEMLGVSGFVDRFDREARVLASLEHANIVPISDLGAHDGLPFFVMPYLPGGSLADRRLRDAKGRVKPMQPATLHLWLQQVAAALDHVHAAGVVHRDVKPANIFFNSSWRPYLGDFGIAKIVADDAPTAAHEPLTAMNMAIGTPEYMAPEMFNLEAKIDGRIDQYALAVVVFELLAGKRPFAADGNLARILADVKNTPPPCSATPAATCLHRCNRPCMRRCPRTRPIVSQPAWRLPGPPSPTCRSRPTSPEWHGCSAPTPNATTTSSCPCRQPEKRENARGVPIR